MTSPPIEQYNNILSSEIKVFRQDVSGLRGIEKAVAANNDACGESFAELGLARALGNALWNSRLLRALDVKHSKM
jgi:hypothetical protein